MTYTIKHIPGWPGYYADTNGDVWSDRTGKLMKLTQSPGTTGHPRVTLHSDGKQTTALVSNLMLLTYAGPRPPKHLARHLDNDPLNVRPDNLRWATRSEIVQAQVARGTHKGLRDKGEANPRAKLSEAEVLEIRHARAHGATNAGLATLYRVAPSTITAVVKGDRWKHLTEGLSAA